MKHDYAGAHVARHDFERLRSACHYDASFPATYETWLQLVAEGSALAEQMGEPRPSPRIEVDVDEFIGWCATNAVHPCLPAMRAFLIVKRQRLHRVSQGGL